MRPGCSRLPGGERGEQAPVGGAGVGLGVQDARGGGVGVAQGHHGTLLDAPEL